MNGPDPHGSERSGPGPALRIGTPERLAAQDALEVHLREKRLDPAEFDRRVAACQEAGTQEELLRIFADLPAPHPELPSAGPAPVDPDDGDDGDDGDVPPVAVAGCLTLGLGLPVAVVLGVVYDAWWALAVPVTVTVLMTYVEQLRQPPRRPAGTDQPRPAD